MNPSIQVYDGDGVPPKPAGYPTEVELQAVLAACTPTEDESVALYGLQENRYTQWRPLQAALDQCPTRLSEWQNVLTIVSSCLRNGKGVNHAVLCDYRLRLESALITWNGYKNRMREWVEDSGEIVS